MARSARRSRRRTVARHANLPRRSALTGILVRVLAGVAAIALAAVGVIVYNYNDLTGAIRDNAVSLQNDPIAPPELAAYPGAFNMLVIGTDECDESIRDFIGADRCSGEEAAHHLNDVNILVHVSEAPRRVTVLSFPRDLLVERPECTNEEGNVDAGGTAKINTAYEAGGLVCVAKTVEELTGLSVDFAAKLSFLSVIKITDAVGGVTVCVAGDGIKDRHTNLDLPPGEYTISGGDALQFLRTRHGLNQESDLARISNQQQYMSRLINKLRSTEVLSNPATLLKLASVVARNIQTDDRLADPVRMVQLALAVKDVPFSDFVFVSYPVVDIPNTSDLAADSATAASLMAAIAANQPIVLSRTGAGVVDETAPTEAATAGPDGSTPTESEPGTDEGSQPGTDVPSAEPTGPVELGWSASGQTAEQQTCSAGVEGTG
ncbi:LCP family protein [Microbacterium nymphoidis]|jgi:LCP family protein required for cell wall assembly|uniref:LCP family protein n=1 Tax=Microbacterium nymphoidis TaxID=2898586 RepID=UPI001E38F9D3|nr:LCP family protein [Microbacterium nymphoidis]MCD2498290.1 LCP family protein [Microbacterium nymphoidis]